MTTSVRELFSKGWVLFMLMVIALGLLGLGYGLWTKQNQIEGVVNLNTLDVVFDFAFTDDDNVVNDPSKDAGDDGYCPPHSPDTSCDPAASEDGIADDLPGGPGPEPRYDKDIGECFAVIPAEASGEKLEVTIYKGYPSYYCTAFFEMQNVGNLPVKLSAIKLNGQEILPSTVYDLDLDQDGDYDLNVHVTSLQKCQQLEPADVVQGDLDMHIKEGAPEGKTVSFFLELIWQEYNHPCGDVLLYHGNSGVAPGNATGYSGSDGELFSLKAHYEAQGRTVDYTGVWPADLSHYDLVVLYGPGNEDDTDDFTAAQVADLSTYIAGCGPGPIPPTQGCHLVVATDWNDFGGTNVPNNLLSNLGVGIQKRVPADRATPDGDACAPLTDITPDPATANISALGYWDPSATVPLDLSGTAVSLARVDPDPYYCLTPGDSLNGETVIARQGRVLVNSDANSLDDSIGFADPVGDGKSGAQLADDMLNY